MTADVIVRYSNPHATDEWATPALLYRRLDAEFSFAFDLAASPANHKCDRWYGEQADGTFIDSLEQDWSDIPDCDGRYLWINPPYRTLGPWVKKAYADSQRGARIVMLLPVKSETAFWHDSVMRAREIRLLRGRLTYEGPQSYPARFPSCVAVFTPWYRGAAHIWAWDWRQGGSA